VSRAAKASAPFDRGKPTSRLRTGAMTLQTCPSPLQGINSANRRARTSNRNGRED